MMMMITLSSMYLILRVEMGAERCREGRRRETAREWRS